VDRSRIGIVIPALNEEKTIAGVIQKTLAYGTPIVVDDGSTDRTAALAKEQGAIVVSLPKNLGYDKALDSGFVKANEIGCEYIVTVDADGQHDPTLLNRFFSKLDEGADVVVGIRDKRQRLGESIFAVVGSLVWKIKDPLCGMKAYRRNVYQELGHFDSYDSIGTELAIFAAKSGKKISQIDIQTRDRVDVPRFGRRFIANKRILRSLWIALTQ
jgi:glycosyltransferase involved in cell wall biosynthesis